jgi:hypothetical protein
MASDKSPADESLHFNKKICPITFGHVFSNFPNRYFNQTTVPHNFAEIFISLNEKL